MKLKATIRCDSVPAKLTVQYDGTGGRLTRDEQREQFTGLVSSIAKCLLDSKISYAGKINFQDVHIQ